MNGTEIEEAGDIAERFPVRIYSQKQLFELARDPNALLAVIDDSDAVRAVELQRELDEVSSEYLALRAQARALMKEASHLPTLQANLADTKRKLDVLQHGGHTAALQTHRARSRYDQALKSTRTSLDAVLQRIEADVRSLSIQPSVAPEPVAEDQAALALRRVYAAIEANLEVFKTRSFELLRQVARACAFS